MIPIELNFWFFIENSLKQSNKNGVPKNESKEVDKSNKDRLAKEEAEHQRFIRMTEGSDRPHRHRH